MAGYYDVCERCGAFLWGFRDCDCLEASAKHKETTMTATLKVYTEKEISGFVADYATHHEVETDKVEVLRVYVGEGIVGFRLSLDTDGKSHGCDEKYGLGQ